MLSDLRQDQDMMSSGIKVYTPCTLSEAVVLLSDHAPRIHVLAGGTDLMVSINTHVLTPEEVLNIWQLDELRGISFENGRLRLAALTTYSQIIRSSLVAQHCPILVDAAQVIGARQTQNRGTLGGNIVNASPAGDTLPVLAAFNAELELGSVRGVRIIPFNDFYTGYRRSVLAPDELLLAVRIAPKQTEERLFFYKLGTRRAQAISKVVMAVRARMEESHIIRSIQIGLGSVAPTVVRAQKTESLLTGHLLTRKLIEQAKETIQHDICPITDFRSTEHYRRTTTANLLARFLCQLLGQENTR
jgi:carbon-monoxide dehydrogenase medium subunit